MRLLIPLPFVALVCAASCREATQITLDLSTDENCGSGIITNVETGLGTNLAPRATTTACTQGTIGSLVVVPKESNDEHILVQVNLAVGVPIAQCTPPAFGPNCIVARRSISFAAHTPLTLPIALRTACRGVVCGADETCVNGACLSAVVDIGRCTSPGGCSETSLVPPPPGNARDAGSPVDPGPPAVVPPPTLLQDAGTTGPVQLFSNSLPVNGLAVDGDNVYIAVADLAEFAAPGAIYAVPKAGGPTTPLASPLSTPSSPAVNTSTVFWLENDAIRSVSKATKVVTTITPAEPGTSPLGLQADDGSLYWGTNGKMLRANTDGTSPTTIGLLQGTIFGTALAGGTLAFAGSDGNGNGQTKLLTLPSTEIFTVNTSAWVPGVVAKVAVAGNRIAWSDAANAGTMSFFDGTEHAIGQDQGLIYSVAADDVGVYWNRCPAFSAACSLESMTWTGTKRSLLALTNRAEFLVVSDGYLYFSESTSPQTSGVQRLRVH